MKTYHWTLKLFIFLLAISSGFGGMLLATMEYFWSIGCLALLITVRLIDGKYGITGAV